MWLLQLPFFSLSASPSCGSSLCVNHQTQATSRANIKCILYKIAKFIMVEMAWKISLFWLHNTTAMQQPNAIPTHSKKRTLFLSHTQTLAHLGTSLTIVYIMRSLATYLTVSSFSLFNVYVVRLSGNPFNAIQKRTTHTHSQRERVRWDEMRVSSNSPHA